LQGPILGLLRTRQYLNETYGQCLKVDDRATVQGIGDGGYAAIHVADALRRFGVIANKVFVGAAPTDLAKLLADIVGHIDANGGSISEVGLLDKYLMTLYTYSAEIVGVNNTGSGITFASDSYREVLVKGLANPNPIAVASLLQQLPLSNATALLNPEFLQLLRSAAANDLHNPCNMTLLPDEWISSAPTASPVAGGNGTDFGGSGGGQTSGTVQVLCKALNEASSLPILSGRSDFLEVIYDTEICFALNDTDIQSTSAHYPPFVFNYTLGQIGLFINLYEGIFEGPESLVPKGNHAIAKELCKMSPMLYFGVRPHAPEDETMKPHYRRPLSEVERNVCLTGSTGPTLSPSIAGAATNPPSNGGGSGGGGGVNGSGGGGDSGGGTGGGTTGGGGGTSGGGDTGSNNGGGDTGSNNGGGDAGTGTGSAGGGEGSDSSLNRGIPTSLILLALWMLVFTSVC
jgi:hypothetical protein